MILTVLGIVALFGAPVRAADQDSPAGLSVTLKAKADQVHVGSAVVVEVTLKNTSGHELEVPSDSAGTDVDVQDENGHAVDEIQDGRVFRRGSNSIPQPDGSFILKGDRHGSKAMLVTMKPNETWKHEIVVSKLFDFRQPGKYTIQAKRSYSDANVNIFAKSNVVTVTVVP